MLKHTGIDGKSVALYAASVAAKRMAATGDSISPNVPMELIHASPTAFALLGGAAAITALFFRTKSHGPAQLGGMSCRPLVLKSNAS
jgi:hypothetical protein